MQKVIHADVELWLTAWIRARASALTVGTGLTLAWVSNTDRPTTAGGAVKAKEAHVIVRDDSGSRRDLLLKDNGIGITLVGATRTQLAPLRTIGERLVATIEADAPTDPTSPVADVPGVNGPYTVPSTNDEARLYAALSLTLVGRGI